VFAVDISGRDLILLGEGMFLIAKATLEIHAALEGGAAEQAASAVALLAEGLDLHMSKTRIYVVLAFSLGVGMLNLRLRGHGEPAMLKKRPEIDEEGGTL